MSMKLSLFGRLKEGGSLALLAMTIVACTTRPVEVPRPVPTKNHLWVSFNGQVPQSFEYLLFDQLGKPVIEGQGEGANHMIDLTVLQAGVYYLQIKTVNMAIFRYKIVKH